MLGKDEERALLDLAQGGDQEALDKLVYHNMPLVIKLAKRYIQGCDFLGLSDLIDEGVMGLMRAISKFDYKNFDCRFTTYATPWLQSFLGRAKVSQDNFIYIPPHAQKKLELIQRVYNLASQFNDSDEECFDQISKQLGTDEIREAEELYQMELDTFSMESVVGNGDFMFEDIILEDCTIKSNEEKIEDSIDMGIFINACFDVSRLELLKQNRRNLSKVVSEDLYKMKVIICHTFGVAGWDELPVKDIQSRYDILPECFEQLKKRALLELKHFLMEVDYLYET
jgi:RNA polymerase primary sigma factor